MYKNEETQVFILFFWNFYYVYNFLSDYDAPVTENGAYTPKYDKAAEMIATYDSLANVISKPERPEYISPQAYPNVKLNRYLTLEQLLDNVVCTYDYIYSTYIWSHIFIIFKGMTGIFSKCSLFYSLKTIKKFPML